MPRINRWLEPGAIFHVMNRGVDRVDIFWDDDDRRVFLKILEKVSVDFQCVILAYCLMGNHFHLLLRDEECSLSEMLRALSLKFVRHINLIHMRDGPLFRGRFKSVRVTTDEQLRSVIDYIHFNPLKDGFVQTARDWNWSSLRYYEDPDLMPDWMRRPTPDG